MLRKLVIHDIIHISLQSSVVFNRHLLSDIQYTFSRQILQKTHLLIYLLNCVARVNLLCSYFIYLINIYKIEVKFRRSDF